MDPLSTKGPNHSECLSEVPIGNQYFHNKFGVRSNEFGVKDLKKKCSELRTNYSQLILNQPIIRQTSVILSGQNDVVENLYSHHPACLHQLLGDPDVFFARIRIAARMIVKEDDSCGGFQESLPKDIPRMDDARIECPFGNRHLLNQPIGTAEEKNSEDLLPQILHQREIKICHILCSLERRLG